MLFERMKRRVNASATLTITFIAAHRYCSVFKSSKVSRLKVEKVLKPPQKPIVKKRRPFGESCGANRHTTIASKAVLTMLDTKVANGNPRLIIRSTPMLMP